MSARRKPTPEDFALLRQRMPARVQLAMDAALSELPVDLVVLPTFAIHGNTHGPLAILATTYEHRGALIDTINRYNAAAANGWLPVPSLVAWAWPNWWQSARLYARVANRLADLRRERTDLPRQPLPAG